MADNTNTRIPEALQEFEAQILGEWIREQTDAVTWRTDLINESELRAQSAQFITLLREATQGNNFGDIQRPNWLEVREFLDGVSHSRALQGIHLVGDGEVRAVAKAAAFFAAAHPARRSGRSVR